MSTSASPISKELWNISFGELLGPEVQTRLRPHFFPFTEPSFELDIRLPGIQDGKWMELLGCGIVNPAVFEAVNLKRGDNAYDPENWTGFAFGMGLERLAMSLFAFARYPPVDRERPTIFSPVHT